MHTLDSMRRILSTVVAALLLAGPAATSASAITIEDLVNLRANGLGDDILVALIDADGSVFQLTAVDVLALRKRGLSERVILAMLITGKAGTRAPGASVSPVPPAAHPAHVTQTVIQTVERVEREIIAVPVAVPVLVDRPKQEEKSPVYWGFGGRLRPGSWQNVEK